MFFEYNKEFTIKVKNLYICKLGIYSFKSIFIIFIFVFHFLQNLNTKQIHIYSSKINNVYFFPFTSLLSSPFLCYLR